MRNKIIHIFLLIFFCLGIKAQENCNDSKDAVVKIESIEIENQVEFCVNVSGVNFVNINRIQTKFLWDTELINFNGIKEDFIGGFTINESEVNNGSLALLWIAGFGDEPLNISDSTNLFKICFEFVNQSFNNTIIEFDRNDNSMTEIINSNGLEQNLCLENSIVSFANIESFSCRERDSLALIALYNATDGPNWTNTWDTLRSIDQWWGITLNESGCVKTINLERNNLNGMIPPKIGGILDLENLVLIENNLKGAIPIEIGNLTKLKILVLYDNNLSGSIPKELDNLQDLEQLYLNQNLFSGCIPKELLNLCFLTSENRISCFDGGQDCQYEFGFNPMLPWTGDFKRFCDREEQIGALCDDGNAQTVNDQINQDCKCIGEIQMNDCDDNISIIGAKCDDGDFRTFSDKYNDNCECVGIIPSCTNDAEHLYSLYEQCDGPNWLRKDFENDIEDLPYNWNLNLPIEQWDNVFTNGNGCVTNLFINGYGKMIINEETGETQRIFQQTGIKGELPQELQNLKYLQYFSIINDDSLVGPIPEYFGNFQELISLNLSGNGLDGIIPQSLNKLCKLQFLSLDRNRFVNPIPKLDSLQLLRSISLSNNSFSGDMPTYFCGLDSLRSLNLSFNEFVEAPLLECLKDLSFLENLSLNGINAIGGFPSWLCDYDFLRSIGLGSNCLDDELPACFGSMDSLTFISIPFSKLTGLIPESYCNLEDLRVLNLSDNELNGEFPSCFNDFENLEIATYGDNNLSGKAHDMNDEETDWYFIDNNCFTEMPDLTHITGWTTNGTAILCNDNKLTFEDLLKNETVFNDSTLNTFYAPQLPIYEDTIFQVINESNFSIDLIIDEDIADNVYTWFKDGVELKSVTGNNNLEFKPIVWADEGVYTVEVTNPQLPALTLISHPIKIEILCNNPTSFVTQQLCQSDELLIGDQVFDADNPEGEVLLKTTRGCDSTVMVSLQILPENVTFVARSLCENEEEIILGQTFSAQRLFGVIMTEGTNGCMDSTVVNLSLVRNPSAILDTFICVEVESLVINQEEFSESGIYSQIFGIVNECDSILTVSIRDAVVGDPCDDFNPNTDNDAVREDCTCLGEPPCISPTIREDEFFISTGEDATFNIIDNDDLPVDREINILSVSEPSGTYRLNLSDQLFVSVDEDIVDDILIEYEACDLSCEVCSSNFVTIRNEIFRSVFPTNAFSPNGDGENDLLQFSDDSVIDNSELWIYNRWGDQIYHRENYRNNWDGGGYPDGVYFYVLQVGETVLKKSLTIIR